MCGIAGVMLRSLGQPPADLLDRLADALGHRGPDGRGRYVKNGVGLVQTRLAIIDLATGDQPLFEPGGAALVANGEIYNNIELRRDLAGAVFTTQSDCEPPLHLYRRYGLNFADHLRGMYAIALHDPGTGRLVLSRDPFGIKPLYYAETADGFFFASEPQALLAAGVLSAEIHDTGRDEVLQLQFSTGPATPLEGIRRVLPGETLVVLEGRVVERRRRAALPCGAPVVQSSESRALDGIDQVLAESVDVHCRSDVPYGLFLSGGIDSALVLSYMAARQSSPVPCYTVGFTGQGAHDERDGATLIARACKAEHRIVEFSERDFWTLLPAIAATMDDPAADYACLPTFKLASLAAQDVKVVLTGEGGDELFGGYGRYRSIMRPWWLGGRMLRGRGILERAGVLRRDLPSWRDGIQAAEVTEAQPGRTRLQIAQAVDCADWLPNDLLTKLDRCLMAHGLEGRTPFLDPEVAAFAFALPDRLKVQRGRGKHLLRRLLARRLPDADALGRKKGFTVPVADWIAREGARLGPLMAAQPALQPFCHPRRLEQLYSKGGKHAGHAAWTLLFYVLWHRHHILRKPMPEDVFAALAAV